MTCVLDNMQHMGEIVKMCHFLTILIYIHPPSMIIERKLINEYQK